MSPTIRHYLNLKRRLRAKVDARNDLAVEIIDAERVLADIEAGFTEDERTEWKKVGLPEGEVVNGAH